MPAPPTTVASKNSRLIWGTLLVQFALVSVSFPITQLVTQAPLFYIDSPFHWYEIEVAKNLAAEWRLVGYDPYFAAGYTGGVDFNASAKFPAALCIILSPWLSTIVTYKLYVFGAAVLGPVGIPLAARWLGLSGKNALAATVFALLLWWVSGLRWFQTAGMVSFVFASYIALPYAALVIRFLTGSLGWPVFVLLAVIGAAGIFLHPHFPILVAFLSTTLIWAYWLNVDLRRLIVVFAVLPELCLLPNLFWILPSLKYPGFANGDLSPYQKAADLSIVWNEAWGRITEDARGSRLNMVVWFAVLWVFWGLVNPLAKRIGIAVTLSAAGLILFAALGSTLPLIAPLQPNRLSAAAYLYLCIPAGFGAVAVFENLRSRGIRKVVAIGSGGLLLAAFGFSARELARELSYADIPHHGERPPEVRGIGEDSAWILEWLNKNTSNDARVLFETSKGRIHDEAHMAGYYALTSDREFIGGPYPYMHFAGFWDGYVFGRPIQSFSEASFLNYLRLYNIGWIIVSSQISAQFLDSVPEVTPLGSFGPIRTYAVEGPRSFFLQGSGTVSARSINRVELSHLSGPSVVLKYHYAQGLESVPPAHLEPVLMPGDPGPFIQIVDPPPELVLRMR
jgi:hypothetical protein